MATAAAAAAEPLAALAVDETGFGVVADKIQKNLFAARTVHEFIRPMKTVGVVRSLSDRRVLEIAQPFGVVAAVIPSTNPTSTTIYKILIAIKARCALVISPHPAAIRCISQTAELMNRAGLVAGLPDGAITWMQTVTLEGTQELMRHRDVAVILATGGMGLVRAAYSAGKPAYGVGPGNAPAYIERSADLPKAVQDIVTGKTFDNGLLCSAENSVVVDHVIADDAKREFKGRGAVFLSATECDALAKVPRDTATAAQSGSGRESRHGGGDGGGDHGAGRHPRVDRSSRRCGPQVSVVGRETVPRPFVLCRRGLEGRVRTMYRDSPVRGYGSHDVDSLARRHDRPRVRPQEASVSNRRQHANNSRGRSE